MSRQILPQELIRAKRDGLALGRDAIRQLVAGIRDGTLSDAQVGALAMAIFLRGMEAEETVALTEAQAGLWFAQRLAPDNPSFNTAHAVWIDGPLDVAAFIAAADQAAGEAQAFALRFAEGADGQPLQWHDPAHVPLLSVRDVSTAAGTAGTGVARIRRVPGDYPGKTRCQGGRRHGGRSLRLRRHLRRLQAASHRQLAP